VTAGELGHAAETSHEQPLTAIDHPGADTAVGEPDAVADGPFSTRQLLRLDEALRSADQQTGLTFSVYIGELDPPTRESAEKLHKQIDDADHAVLIAVSPNQRILEIVTGGDARRRIPDRACKLAALSMSAAFSGGDLGGGIVSGIAQLVEHAGKNRS